METGGVRRVAMAALLQVAADPKAAASAKAQAARTLLEAVGTVGPKGAALTEREEAELHLMTAEEMKAELVRLGVAPIDEAY